MQIGFYFDQTRCIGCDTCVVACKDYNDIPPGVYWNRVTGIERGEYPNLFVAFLVNSCYHCAEPACVSACPAGAIVKRKRDGIVIIEEEKCLGYDRCCSCREACPYDIPVFGSEKNAKAQKCNFCIDHLALNKKPICVDGCPTRALDASNLYELRVKYGDVNEAPGFTYSTETKPSIVFKPKQ
jgi:anaerobic dimethyl sulfoxide reductase subunit B